VKKTILISLLMTLFLLLSATACLASDLKTVTVKGYGISSNEALNDALRSAVEQAVGTLVDSQTLVKNAEVLSDEIYTKSQGFVQNYDILAENKSSGQVVLTVKVVINTAPNSALLNQLQKLKLIHLIQDPRIAVIIPEYHITRPIPDPAGETAVIRKLREAGFSRILDHRQIEANRYRNVVKALNTGDTKAALTLATKYDLDYLIVGEGFSEFYGRVEGSNVLSCRARVEARIFKTDTAQIIAANGFHAGGVDITESTAAKAALNNAGEMMGDYMVEQLLSYASNPDKGLQLLVKGLPSYNKVSILEDNLKEIRGMKEVYIRDYSNGLATIDLNYTGNAKTLARSLETLSDISLDVTEMNNSSIQAVVKY